MAEKEVKGECPKFGGDKGAYKEWKGKVDDWCWRWGKIDKYPGLTIRSALQGEPWELIEGIKKEDLAKKDGVEKIFSILDKKYGEDLKREKIRNMNELFRIERKKDEKIKDFVSRFDMIMRKCISNGMPELSDVHKGGLLLGRSKLDERDEKIMLGIIDDEISYKKVTDSLLNIFGKEEIKEEEKIWWSQNKNPNNREIKCYICNEIGHISRNCDKRKKIEDCKTCGRRGHNQETCRFKGKKCYKCGKVGHISTICEMMEKKEENKEEEKIVLYGEIKNDINNEWNSIMGVIDTGCKSTIVGDL